MVLESLINPFNAEKSPYKMLFLGVIYSSIALFLSFWIFRQYSSLVMVFLTVLACIPLVYAIMKYEEKKDIIIRDESVLLKEHTQAIKALMFLFFGITLSFAFWYVILPHDFSETLFSVQSQTIVNINKEVTSSAIEPAGFFLTILANNIKVLIFCLLFAFIYGVGAIFILVWNASVIAAAIGNFIRTNIASHISSISGVSVAAYFKVVSLGVLRYSLHGILEIVAYFVAGLAGGIISIAVINHDFGSTKFRKIVLDSSNLVLISLMFLVLSALVEVYVTPLFF